MYPYISGNITINNTIHIRTHIVSASINLRVPHLYKALTPVVFDMTCIMGAESNLNSSTPRVYAIRHLPFRPSALATVVLRRVSTSEDEIPCCDRHAYASACCPAHSFKINACYNLLLLRTYTFTCRREGCRRDGRCCD